MSHTIAAVSTGSQVSAIGILRLSGEDCAEIAGKVFQRNNGAPLSDAPDRKLVLGSSGTGKAGSLTSVWQCTPVGLTPIPARTR